MNTITFNGNGNTSGSMSQQKLSTNQTAALKANAFVKKGYYFIGWALTADGSVAYTDRQQYKMDANSNYTLYAKWEANSYSVYYDANGGTISTSAKTVKYDSSYTLALPTRAGYNFDGWYLGKTKMTDASGASLKKYDNNGDVTVTASWSPKLNAVILVNGDSRTTVKGYTDSFISLPRNTQTKSGWLFEGWAETNGGEVKYKDADLYKVTTASGTTLYGVWKDYSGYQAVSNRSDLLSIISNPKGKYYLTNDIDLGGYEWAGIKEFSGELDGRGFGIYNLVYKVTDDYRYADKQIDGGYDSNWRRIIYYCFYSGFIKTNRGTVKDLTVYDYSYSKNNAGWYQYWAGLVVINEGLIDNCHASLPYWISFDNKESRYSGIAVENSGTIKSKSGTRIEYILDDETYYYQYFDSHEAKKALSINYDKAGYTLIGWSTTKNGSKVYGPDDYVQIDGDKNSMTLYAVFKKEPLTLSFDPNGGSGSMSSITVYADTNISLPDCSFTAKQGYHFAGWATSPDGEVLYQNKGDYTSAGFGETLYAQWEPNENSVVFNANGGSGAMSSQKVKTDETVTLTKCAFTAPSGRYFAGWATSPDGEVKYYDCDSYTGGTSSVYNLYAVWEEL